MKIYFAHPCFTEGQREFKGTQGHSSLISLIDPVALLQYISDSRNNVGDGDAHKIIRFEGLYGLATDNNQTIKTNNFA